MDLLHETSVRHDEMIRDLEYKHLGARHQLRGELLQRQHQVELSDQREYMQRAELEQKQRHLSEARQQPKNLKVPLLPLIWLSVLVNHMQIVELQYLLFKDVWVLALKRYNKQCSIPSIRRQLVALV